MTSAFSKSARKLISASRNLGLMFLVVHGVTHAADDPGTPDEVAAAHLQGTEIHADPFTSAPKFEPGTSRQQVLAGLAVREIEVIGQTDRFVFVNAQHRVGEVDSMELTHGYRFGDNGLDLGPVNYLSLRLIVHFEDYPIDLVTDLAALVTQSANSETLNDVAWDLASLPQLRPEHRSIALTLAIRANELDDWSTAEYLDTLAVAYAGVGDFTSAINYESQAIAILESDDQDYLQRLALFEQGTAFTRDTVLLDAAILIAAENDDPAAQYKVGAHCLEYDVELLGHPGLYWIERAADQGYPDAQNEMGFSYLHGTWGVQKDIRVASNWLLRSAENGDPLAAVNLAILYGDAGNDFHDEEASFRWLKFAAENSYFFAKFELAFRYGTGLGTRRNTDEQHRILVELEQLGYQPAAYLMDNVYFSTRSEKDSLVEFLTLSQPTAYELPGELVKLAAHLERQLGNGLDSISISWESDETTTALGWSKEMAPEIIFNLYQVAARFGNIGAQLKLAHYYEIGRGTEKSARGAQFWRDVADGAKLRRSHDEARNAR